jgi:hypothetical protein
MLKIAKESSSVHLGFGLGICSFKSSPGDTKAHPESRTIAGKATLSFVAEKKCYLN